MKVSACIIAYNHENYIIDCLEGALSQKVNFDYEIVIGEDKSTDATLKICEEYASRYPDKIRLIKRDVNLGMIGNWVDTIKSCKGIYIAICEGDDYWTDPLKLQKQVSFLEANPEFGLVHTDSSAYNQFNGKFETLKKVKYKYDDSVFEELMFGNAHIYTLTVCFRKELLFAYIQEILPFSKNWLMGDLPLWLFISNKNKVHYINDITSVYRILDESASNTKDINKYLTFAKSTLEIRLFFLEKYYKNDLEFKKLLLSTYLYQQLVANISYKGNMKQFYSFLRQFYFGNSNSKLFLGSFYQIFKKIKNYVLV